MWKDHVEKAAAHGPFADANHIDGCLAEEVREFQREIDAGSHEGMIDELLDIAAVAHRAAAQLLRQGESRRFEDRMCCGNPWCRTHNMHAFECPCPPEGEA